MAHAIKILKCKNGHSLPFSFDSNECGCHHDGKPCIIISCKECFIEELKTGKVNTEQIYLPLDKDTINELEKLTGVINNTKNKEVK